MMKLGPGNIFRVSSDRISRYIRNYIPNVEMSASSSLFKFVLV